jgi:raffinose/stachyose/melibiose transport system substrate-binding protein
VEKVFRGGPKWLVKRALVMILSVGMLAATACGDAREVEEGSNIEAFTIRVGAWFIDDREFMKQFQANTEQAYKKLYPHATIQWEITLGNAYFGKLETQLASNSAPDVIFHQQVVSMIEAGYLSDLSSEPWAFRFIPQIQQFLTYNSDKDEFKIYDGKVYAASMGVGIRGYWYNKTLFEQLGLKAPKNMQELLEICARLKKDGYLPLAAGHKDRWSLVMHFETLLQSVGYGADLSYGVGLTEGRNRLDGDEVASTMQFFETLYEREYLNRNALSIDWMQSLELFTSQQAAMIMQGPWLPGTVESKISSDAERFELGFFPISDENGYYDLEFVSDQYVSVNAASKLQEESKALIGAMLSDDAYLPFARENGLLPAIEGLRPSFGNPVMEEVFRYAEQAETNQRWTSFISTESHNLLLEEAQNILMGVPFERVNLVPAQKKLEEKLAVLKQLKQ